MDVVPTARSKAPIESKVKSATYASYLGGLIILSLLEALSNDPTLLAGLPNWLTSILLPLIPTLLTLAAGWKAKHTPRPDLEPAPPAGPAVPPSAL